MKVLVFSFWDMNEKQTYWKCHQVSLNKLEIPFLSTSYLFPFIICSPHDIIFMTFSKITIQNHIFLSKLSNQINVAVLRF